MDKITTKDAIRKVIESDIALECGVGFYKCWSGEYIVNSIRDSEMDSEGNYPEFHNSLDFDAAYRVFIEKTGIKED